MLPFAYFGTPYVARDTLVRLVEADYTPRVVVTSPAAPKGRGLALTPSATEAWARDRGIPVCTPDVLDAATIAQIAAYGCELGITVAYGKILPQALIDAFPKGMVNIHYSLLPKYRGASPVEAALLHGDAMTGVTVQQMTYELDAGDILAQREIPIDECDTALTLRPRLIHAGAELLLETLPAVAAGTISRVPQDPAAATRAPKIRKSEGELSLAADSRTNWNTYRAFKESPGTYFFAEKDGGRIRVKVADAELRDGRFAVTRIIPEGKAEQPFDYLERNGWTPAN